MPARVSRSSRTFVLVLSGALLGLFVLLMLVATNRSSSGATAHRGLFRFSIAKGDPHEAEHEGEHEAVAENEEEEEAALSLTPGEVSHRDELALVTADGKPALLSKESLGVIADSDKHLIVAFANYLFREMALNLYAGLVDARASGSFVMIALDDHSAEHFASLGISTLVLDRKVIEAKHDDGRSRAFKDINRAKYAAVSRMVGWGFHVLVLDVDVAILRNPLPWLKTHGQEYDLMLQTDYVDTSTFDGPELLAGVQVHYYCIGVMYARSTPSSRTFLTEWVNSMEKNHALLDQDALMSLFRARFKPQLGLHRKFVYGDITVGALPTLLFCNGHVFFVQRLPAQYGIEPILVHTTFQFGYAAGKVHALREAHLWHDNADYYKGKFLSFALDLPPDLLVPEFVAHGKIANAHIASIRHQLSQLYRAFAIARTLGRVLILPRFMCLCERYWWYLDDCHVGSGKHLTFPFACPLDQILNTQTMADAKLDFRAWSFAEHHSAPPELTDSRYVLRLDPQTAIHEAEIAAVAEAHKDAPVIHLTSTGASFHFTSKHDGDSFRELMKSITSVWCCWGGGRDTVDYWQDKLFVN